MDSGFVPTASLDQLATNFHLKVGEEATFIEHVCADDFEMKEPKIYCEGESRVGEDDHVQLSVINEEEHCNEKQLFKRKYKLKALKKGTCFIKFPKDNKKIKFTITE